LPAERPSRDREADDEPAEEHSRADPERRERRPTDHHLAERIGQVGQRDQPRDAWSELGIWSIAKNVPDRNIIGNWITEVIPFAESSVLANDAMT
jgi:hypothetical protein